MASSSPAPCSSTATGSWRPPATTEAADLLTRVADLGIAHPRRVAVVALLLFVAAVAVGGPAAGKLGARDAFRDPASESARAQRVLERATHTQPSAGVLALVDAPPGSPAVASAARTLRADPAVAGIAVPRGARAPALVSRDGRSSLVAATLHTGGDTNDVAKRLLQRFADRRDVRLGGTAVAGAQVNDQATHDLGAAELLAFPLLALLTFVFFRGIAALLPVAVGACSVFGTFVVLLAVNAALPLSSFALNLVIGGGLGLAIDYSLYMVARFREEVSAGADPPTAVRRTVRTAGRTVLFSGLTVSASMACLALFPQRFLVSMGIGGAVVALVAVACSLLLLPALFMLLGARLGGERRAPTGGRWYRLAHAVMRRPAAVALVTAAALLVLAAPALRAQWSGIDASVLPTSKSARVVSDRLARDFPAQSLNTITIAATAPAAAAPRLAAYADALRAVPGVAGVAAPQFLGHGTWKLTLGARGDPIAAAAQRTLRAVRAVPAPVPALVGGQAADFHDQRTAIADHLPAALLALVLVTVVILWVMTGSVVLPIKALVMNALTTAAAIGLLVLVFQDGRLTGPLAYTSQGGIEQTNVLVLAALVFALATDYGVLLLTRIKEARDGGLSDREAVATGLERTGRLVTVAAILLAVAIGAFSTSKVVFLKEVGLGAAAAVLLDAFVVRTLLVPALMALLGARNWWSPRPLRRLHERLGAAAG